MSEAASKLDLRVQQAADALFYQRLSAALAKQRGDKPAVVVKGALAVYRAEKEKRDGKVPVHRVLVSPGWFRNKYHKAKRGGPQRPHAFAVVDPETMVRLA